MSELTEALRELDSLMTALGASDQAKVQKDLLAQSLGLASLRQAQDERKGTE